MNVLVTQHAATENLGWWDEFFNDIGAQVHYVRAFDGETIPRSVIEYSNRVDAVVSLGGPMNVDEEDHYSWLRDENALIQNCLQNEVPFLGLCLGAQLLAKAAGVQVVRSPQPEVGWLDVELNQAGQQSAIFAGLPRTFKTLQWHGDMFEIPQDGTNLAFSAACPNQALQVGRYAFGLQFHLEVSLEELESWLSSDDAMCEVEGAQSLAEMRRLGRELESVTRAHSRRVFDNFCAMMTR